MLLATALLGGAAAPCLAQPAPFSTAAPANKPPASGAWFVPAVPKQDASVDVHAAVAASGIGDVEQITVLGRRRAATERLDIPDLPGEDMSKYHRDPDYLTREHRAPCAPAYASVGDHEGRGSSLATGLGAAGCD